ncbi:hypothetical protein BDY21DRAFT_198008 [Lineolata rhizophorae]|uniref:N-acetyltransferase domain-containing protein n=1 Tax=Lineolata rhizophorae TaxID=578093 RepID=A0A6A6P4J9_9PEZI|nr:hypothetical protein BDY21DRAFT_198008 [Lineolata rhizophorae]
MSAPTYKLRRAEYSDNSDIPAVTKVISQAFKDDAVFGHMMHPHRFWFKRDFKGFFGRHLGINWWNWTHVLIIVTTSTPKGERIVGVADWERHGKHAREAGFGLAWWDPQNLIAPSISTANSALGFFIWPNRARNPSIPLGVVDSAYTFNHLWPDYDIIDKWHLKVLAVHPLHRRKGVGEMLLDWGLRAADRENGFMTVDGDSTMFEHVVEDIMEGTWVSAVSPEYTMDFFKAFGFSEGFIWSPKGVGQDMWHVSSGAVMLRAPNARVSRRRNTRPVALPRGTEGSDSQRQVAWRCLFEACFDTEQGYQWRVYPQ